MSHRCETAARTFRFPSAISPTSTRGAWESKSRVFPTKRWIRSLVIAGRVIYVNCRTLWSEPLCYQPAHRCECRWLKSLLTQPSASTSDNPIAFAERSHNLLSLGLLQSIVSASGVERQLAWDSKGRRSLTKCRSWGSLGHPSCGHRGHARNLRHLVGRPDDCAPLPPMPTQS